MYVVAAVWGSKFKVQSTRCGRSTCVLKMEATQAAAAVATSASGGQTEESWMWDTKYHRMSCGGISDAVSVAEFRSNCRGHLEMVDGDCITKKVASLPEGPVRDFGLTEMLNVSSGELATVKAECK